MKRVDKTTEGDGVRGSLAAVPAADPGALDLEAIGALSPSLAGLLERARRLATTDVAAVLVGPEGSGRETLARAIHEAGRARSGPFVAVRCGAADPALIGAELFGGGRAGKRRGAFDVAAQGTIYLDEVAALPHRVQEQVRLALQDGVFTRPGTPRTIRVRARVLASAPGPLHEQAAGGRLLPALARELSVAELAVPPLGSRPEEVPAWARWHYERWVLALPEGAAGVAAAEEELARAYTNSAWSGSGDDLRAAVRRLALWGAPQAGAGPRAPGGPPGPEGGQGSPPHPHAPPPQGLGREVLGRPLGVGFSLQEVLREVAAHYLARAMAESGANKTKAAELVGLPSYQTLTNWLQRYGVEG